MDNDGSFDIQVILAFIVSMQFLRFLLSLQISRTFGPMIKILGNMFMDVVTFLILFSTILLIFIAIGQLLFENLNQFTSPIDTINTLLTICVGGFAYNMFDTLDDNLKYAGYIYLTVFIFFAAIVLINFLIAILTNTYEILNQVNYGLYLRKVLQLRQVYDYNRIYSSIVYAIPPLNFLFLFTAPFTIYIGTRKFNRIILIIEYIPILVISILLFTLISLMLSPIALLLILLSLIKSLFAFPVVSLSDIILRVLSLISFIFIGCFQLLFFIILDIINFSLMLFAYNITFISDYEEEKQEQINLEMDGSIKKEERVEIKQIKRRKLQVFKVSSKNINPIKDGLADNTLKLMKA